jgi:hypothetical protein
MFYSSLDSVWLVPCYHNNSPCILKMVRVLHRYHPGYLSVEQIELLERLPGFNWEMRSNNKKKGSEGVVVNLPFYSWP